MGVIFTTKTNLASNCDGQCEVDIEGHSRFAEDKQWLYPILKIIFISEFSTTIITNK